MNTSSDASMDWEIKKSVFLVQGENTSPIEMQGQEKKARLRSKMVANT
jgi:hypothetical protein